MASFIFIHLYRKFLSGKYATLAFVLTPGASPSINISPELYLNIPAAIFKNVVFPLPLGPNNPTIFPFLLPLQVHLMHFY